MKFLFGTLIVLVGILLTSGQRPRPLPSIIAGIPWGGVRERSFTVRWGTSSLCQTYNVKILRSYTNIELYLETNVNGSSFRFAQANPVTPYGAAVQCVGADNRNGTFGRPARIITFGKIPTTPAFVEPPRDVPVGSCGEGRFTCPIHNANEPPTCLPASSWCDENFDCEIPEDEKDCPGHCPEINFPAPYPGTGNMTCSRFNSLDSACFFDCFNRSAWERSGPWYTVCNKGRWSRRVPTCIPFVAAFFGFFDGLNLASLTFQFPKEVNSIRLVNLTTDSGRSINVNTITLTEVNRDLTDDPPLIDYQMSGFNTNEKLHVEVIPMAGNIEGKRFHFDLSVDDYYY